MTDPRTGLPQQPGQPAHAPHPQQPQAHPAQPGLRPPQQVRPLGQPGAVPQMPRPAGQPQVRPPSGPVDPNVDLSHSGGHNARSAVAQGSGDEPLALEELTEEQVTTPQGSKRIVAFGAVSQHRQHDYKRQLNTNGSGASRVKSFHGRYSDQGIEHMDDLMNEWLDAHPEVEVKFVTSTVGIFEGKIREPALVLNLWY